MTRQSGSFASRPARRARKKIYGAHAPAGDWDTVTFSPPSPSLPTANAFSPAPGTRRQGCGTRQPALPSRRSLDTQAMSPPLPSRPTASAFSPAPTTRRQGYGTFFPPPRTWSTRSRHPCLVASRPRSASGFICERCRDGAMRGTCGPTSITDRRKRQAPVRPTGLRRSLGMKMRPSFGIAGPVGSPDRRAAVHESCTELALTSSIFLLTDP
jgi:hypothetical protein